MPRQHTRQELYDLVWAPPTRTVAASLGVADVALAKTCHRADTPIAPHGYWTGKAGRERPFRPALPLLFPAGVDRCEIGGAGG